RYAGVHHFGFMVDDVDETCRKLEAAGAKAMTNRADVRHAAAPGARSYYEIKYQGRTTRSSTSPRPGGSQGRADELLHHFRRLPHRHDLDAPRSLGRVLDVPARA